MSQKLVDLERLQEMVEAGLKSWGTYTGDDQLPLDGLLLVRQRSKTAQENGLSSQMRTLFAEILEEGIQELEENASTEVAILGLVLRLRVVEGLTIAEVVEKLRVGQTQVKGPQSTPSPSSRQSYGQRPQISSSPGTQPGSSRRRLEIKGVNRDVIRRRYERAVQELINLLRDDEAQLREKQRALLAATLNNTPDGLVGLDTALSTLKTTLLQPDLPWVIALTGIGGIGKSTLANELTHVAVKELRFEGVVWHEVRSSLSGPSGQASDVIIETLITQIANRLLPHLSIETTPAERSNRVQQLLRSAPYLIVIDNLESEQDIQTIVNHLKRWVKPSKFILTSRVRPPKEADIYTHQVTELSLGDAAALVRSRLALEPAAQLQQISDEDIQAIYQVVGGNPLALKLVAGLTVDHALADILTNLHKAPPGEIHHMYTRIYWQAWESLSEQARIVLEQTAQGSAMGTTLEQLQLTSELSKELTFAAITELRNRSLLDERYTTGTKRFAIHQLTKSFLLTDIIHLPPDVL